MVWRRVCILGVGLLGGSIGRRLIRDRLATEVVGFGRNFLKLDRAVELGAIHRGSDSIAAAARDADLVVCCLPVQQIPDAIVAAAKVTSSDALLTDVGSTKETLVQAIMQSSAHDRFVGSHPLAGSDRSGVEHSTPTLFDDRVAIVTPTSTADATLVKALTAFWETLGCRVFSMPAAEHDFVMAQTSHLPHVVASILSAATPQELLKFAGSGWSDTTRIASGSTVLWRQILEENSSHVLRALKNFATISQNWIEAIESRDFERVEQLLIAGKKIRDVVGNQHSSD